MLRLLVLCALVFAGMGAPSTAADFRILVATWRGCEDACHGFQDYLAEAGVDAEFINIDAGQKDEAVAEVLERARADGVDLILTWGTNVTRAVAGTLANLDDPAFNHDIPQVFTIVADPVGAGIVESLDNTGRPNVTGTYNRMPEDVTIETIRVYKPDFSHLGLVFNANEKNSVLKRDEMEELSQRLGFEYTAVELPLHEDGEPRADDIAQAVAELAASGVDFIYLGSSSFLQANADAFTEAAIAEGLPVVSPYEQAVRDSHALLSVAARYYDVGRLAGEQAARILVDKKAAGDLPVSRMTDFAVVINLRTAKRLGLFPPIEMLQIAETVN